MRRRLVLATLPITMLACTVATSSAAPKQMKGEYEAAAPVPGGGVDCEGSVPGSLHSQEVELPAAGKLQIELTNFLGDWDLHVTSAGREIAAGTSGTIGGVEDAKEIVSVKLKKAGAVSIGSCNWAGGPTGSVAWTFTPNK
jgi:hypothetical protein